MITSKTLTAAATAFAAFFVLASAAKADVVICNDIRAPIHVAFAYQDRDGFTASGWWNVEGNECRPVDFLFDGDTLYYSANSDGYRDGRETSRDHWGNKRELFVTRAKFGFENADRSRRGTRPEMFSSYDVPQAYLGKPTKITFHFVHGSTSITITGK